METQNESLKNSYESILIEESGMNLYDYCISKEIPIPESNEINEAPEGQSIQVQSKSEINLNRKKKVKVKMFKNHILIDLREYFKSDKGDLLPTKKVICLSIEQWEILKYNTESINSAISDLKITKLKQ